MTNEKTADPFWENSLQNPNRVPYIDPILENLPRRLLARTKKERATKRRIQTLRARKLGAGQAWVRDGGRLRRIPGPNVGAEYLKSKERHLSKFQRYHLIEDSTDSEGISESSSGMVE